MSAGKYSFVIEQGATFTIQLDYKDNTGTPIDLTGYSGKMQIRPTVTSDTVYLTLSSSLAVDGSGLNFSGSGGINPPTSGTIGVVIAASTSDTLNFDQAVYDLEIYKNSTVTRLIEGNVKLSKQVTRL
jgi:hypothetical protein